MHLFSQEKCARGHTLEPIVSLLEGVQKVQAAAVNGRQPCRHRQWAIRLPSVLHQALERMKSSRRLLLLVGVSVGSHSVERKLGSPLGWGHGLRHHRAPCLSAVDHGHVDSVNDT